MIETAAIVRQGLKLYHGGVPGLAPGQKVLPPSLTGAHSCAGYDSSHCRADRVYLTTDPADAAVYAALAWGGRGNVYEVEPLGGLAPDPPAEVAAAAYTAPAATVVAVVRRAVCLEEPVATISALLQTWRRANAVAVPLPHPALREAERNRLLAQAKDDALFSNCEPVGNLTLRRPAHWQT